MSGRGVVNVEFSEVGVALDWQGKGVDEVGICRKSGKVLVQVDPRYFRPTEVETLLGDPGKAKAKLGNEGFLAKAPPEVVEELRERLAEAETTIARLTEARDRLAAM